MKRGLKARLDRRVERIQLEDAAARKQRRLWRVRATMGDLVRWYLARMGIDPATAGALRLVDEAAARLRAIPDSEEMQRADGQGPRDDDEQRLQDGSWLHPLILRQVERYDSGELRQPNLNFTSLADLFAWCIASNAREAPFAGSTEERDVCC